MPSKIGYGAIVTVSDGSDSVRLFMPEAAVRTVLLEVHPEELVDLILDRLRKAAERELRRL